MLKRSILVDWVFEIWTPISRWTPQHSMQTNTPKLVTNQSAPSALQSQQKSLLSCRLSLIKMFFTRLSNGFCILFISLAVSLSLNALSNACFFALFNVETHLCVHKVTITFGSKTLSLKCVLTVQIRFRSRPWTHKLYYLFNRVNDY